MTTKPKPKKQEIMLRLSDETAEKIDRIVARMQTEKPGLPVTRAGICYMLLEAAIAAYETPRPRTAKPCADCGGLGWIGPDDTPCLACNPNGAWKKLDPAKPPRFDAREVLGLDVCEVCGGSGLFGSDIPCSACRGTGKGPGAAG